MAYPSVITTFTNPQATDRLNAPSHSAIEQAQNTNITALETFLGVEGSASTLGTLIYDIRSPGSNGGGHIQTANTGGTGQTNFIKGDILVGQSTSVLTKLSSSGNPDGYALVLDSTQATGIKWGVPNSKPTIRIFSVNGNPSSVFTWNKPSTLAYIRVKVQGPGGASPSIAAGTVSASGGSAGGYAEKIIAASVLGLTEEVRVGGPGVISSTISLLSSFGLSNANASILANPGNPGSNSGTTNVGGTASGGDINITGGSGQGVATSNTGGIGGFPYLGWGGFPGSTTVNTTATPPSIGGGSAGAAHDGSGAATTTNAGTGIVIIEEF